MPDNDPTYEIIGCAMRVHTEMGPGLREKPYENALAIEFEEQKLDFKQQPEFPLFYHNRRVGECYPDFTVRNEVVVDAKAILEIGDKEISQMLNYLRITAIRIGLILNFKNSKLEWKRLVK
ncbi:MAG: GxxExxY protein [Verrucomicrobiales bacterium]|jgi:GxxExxY protein